MKSDKNNQENYENITDAITNQNYFIWGIGYKSAILSYIIRNNYNKDYGLNIIDHGGGYGLLMVELLLNKNLNIKKAITSDVNVINWLLAANLFERFKEMISERFKFHLGPMESYDYDDSYDVITFISSLYLIPKNKVQKTLEKAWEALKPGGLLVVQENIKSNSYQRDYEIMFNLDDLEDALNYFGPIEYYLSTATKKIDKEKVGNKTVFRVIKKPYI